MTMTLLEIAQEFSARTGLDKPLIVMASQDEQVQQIKGLANEVIADITRRGQSWPLLQKQATFTSVAASDQGLMTTLAPYGFKEILLGTLYDRTQRRPLYGPRNGPRWQEAVALPYTGPFYSFRIWQGHFYTQPDLPVGHTIAFEYWSNWAILAVDGTTWKPRFTADTDSFVLDEELLISGLRWRWKAEKGLRFATDQLSYESLLADAIGNDGTKGELSLGGSRNGDMVPGIFVPLGNWPV